MRVVARRGGENVVDLDGRRQAEKDKKRDYLMRISVFRRLVMHQLCFQRLKYDLKFLQTYQDHKELMEQKRIRGSPK